MATMKYDARTMRGINDQVRWKKGDFLTIIVLVLMHEFKTKVQESGDAAAWGTFAPMRLHRQNQCRSMNTSSILAPSATIGGGEVYLHFWQIFLGGKTCCAFDCTPNVDTAI